MTEDRDPGPPRLPPGLKVEHKDSGLEIIEITPGMGRTVGPNDKVLLRYRVWLTTGTRVEASDPAGVWVGVSDPEVIPGWREGLLGMHPGGVRRLIVPSDLAHGPRGCLPHIPPYSTLIYDVECLTIEAVNPLTPPSHG
jgi:FKBP-type peptidyl-prolyl cis-trans isomerase